MERSRTMNAQPSPSNLPSCAQSGQDSPSEISPRHLHGEPSTASQFPELRDGAAGPFSVEQSACAPRARVSDVLEGQRRLHFIQRARELKAANHSWEQIERALGVDSSTLIRWCNQVAHITDPTAHDCMPLHRNAGRKRKTPATAQDVAALRANYAISNRTFDSGSVQEAARMALRKNQLSADLAQEICSRAANGLPLLPEALHQEVTVAPSTVRQFRNPTDADLDFICAPGSMMWVRDHLTNEERIARAGDILEADDGTINFPVCVPWEIGGCPASERWGVKVGRFQFLLAIDAGTRFIPGHSYTARPRGSYRAEDIVSLLSGLFRTHGIWRRARFERGTFESNLVKDTLARLGVELLTVWSPHQKPFIEGLFNSLWTKLSDMPGQVGRFQGEMEAENALLTKCQSGSTDPRKHFPMIHDALAALSRVIAEHNAHEIVSKNYGRWIPADRWQLQCNEGRLLKLDAGSDWLFAPCQRAWTVQGAQVGGSVNIMPGFSIQFDFGAEFLLPFDGCKVKAYFDPTGCGPCGSTATIVLAQDVRDRREGEVLGVAPQINKVARYARRALGYGDDADLGLQHRQKAASALRREVRTTLPDGKPAVQSSEAGDGLGNNLKVERGGSGRAATAVQSAIRDPQSAMSRVAAQSRRQAELIRQLQEESDL